jgi:hypothetical protein
MKRGECASGHRSVCTGRAPDAADQWYRSRCIDRSEATTASRARALQAV